MRIISGVLKGRNFQEPRGHHTHPMSEKIRGALFNALGDIEGLSVLDAFAGSGALAFEAASRGAKQIVAIEKDRAAHSVIENNVKDLGLQKIVHVTKANTGGWSMHNMENRFDIVLLDPPYDELQKNLLVKLAKRHVKAGGLAVLSLPPTADITLTSNFQHLTSKSYGDSQLVFYRKSK